MVTPLSPAAAVSPAAATTTSTCQTQMPVTSGLASAGSACTTARVPTVASAAAATLAMLLAGTVGVSGRTAASMIASALTGLTDEKAALHI